MSLKIVNLSISMLVLSCAAIANSATNKATYNWTGIYVGGFGGGASGAKTTSTEPLRLDNNTDWFRPFHSSYSYNTSSSFIGGGTLGYNWQINGTPYLVGIEGEYGYLNERGSRMDLNQISYATFTHNEPNASSNTTNIGGSYGYGLIGGRIGYVQDRLLFYIKSAAVFTNITSRYSSEKTETTRTAFLNISGANNTTGYAAGGGIEYVLPFKALSNVSIKLEYLYLGINRQQSTYGRCSCDFSWIMTKQISGINTAKFGMNYKF